MIYNWADLKFNIWGGNEKLEEILIKYQVIYKNKLIVAI